MRTQKGSTFPSLGEGLPEKVTFKLVPKDKVEWGGGEGNSCQGIGYTILEGLKTRENEQGSRNSKIQLD